MQTIQALTSLAQEGERAAALHRQTLEGLFVEGQAALQRSAARDFEDKEALLASLAVFHRMLAHDAEDARPYAWIGYICYLMDRAAEARDYLDQARRLDPQEPDTAALLELMSREQESVLFTAWDPDQPRDAQQIDLSLLYSELSACVQARLRRLTQLPSGAQLDRSERDKLDEALTALDPFLSRCREAISMLTEAHPQAELEALLRPLLTLQQQLRRTRDEARQGAGLKRRLGEATRKVEGLLREARGLRRPSDLARFSSDLERCYDECDEFADQLDSLATQGHDTAALEKAYERLLRWVSELQQLCEPKA